MKNTDFALFLVCREVPDARFQTCGKKEAWPEESEKTISVGEALKLACEGSFVIDKN